MQQVTEEMLLHLGKMARELTGGWIAPPTLISAWFRPHHWAPGREREVQPLQVHFDLKDRLALPEAVMTDDEIVFGEPVRPGDRLRTWQVLRSVSEPKRTRLGLGRFVPVRGQAVVHRILPLSLTFDHRCITGGEAARFLQAVISDLTREE